MSKPGKILVFSAPSGAGKTTLLTHLTENVPGLVYSISATTRAPRTGEVDGTHYFFLTKEEFEHKAANNEFAEWQEVHGNYYGTPKTFIDSVIESGRHVVMDIDVFGKLKFDKAYPQAAGIMIVPPSMEHLENRLKSRATDEEEVIRLRLENARTEMEAAETQGKYEYTIVNDDLEIAKVEAVELVKKIIEL
ncbi:MAG: guanylate kinase [Chitinispirillales bacterium]|jgi:guanylate kinase|nr:guanylate kinase [Chitinispirillales bacterium]